MVLKEMLISTLRYSCTSSIITQRLDLSVGSQEIRSIEHESATSITAFFCYRYDAHKPISGDSKIRESFNNLSARGLVADELLKSQD
jgi:hypothetical protein